MKDILTVIKKELKRFFTDYRMLAAMILPGILIYVIYSFMGPLISSNFNASSDYNYQIYTINVDETILNTLSEGFKTSEYNVTFTETTDLASAQTKVKNESIDLIIDYNKTTDIPVISLYYNSAKTESQVIYTASTTILSTIQVDPDNYNFIINPNTDLASAEQLSSTMISMLLPFLLLIFLCTGVMSVAPESIAGEKDRGTIATLLVTPLKRTHLAIGKIISLAIISLVGGISSFIGTILSLPNLMSAQGDLELFYTPIDYVYLLFIIISILFLFVGLYSVVSAFAKSVKEASAYSTPIMIIVIIIGVLSMASSLPTNNIGIYFIPIYNSVVAMYTILSLEANIIGIVISIVSNLVYAVLIAVLLGKMFNSEKIMFNK